MMYQTDREAALEFIRGFSLVLLVAGAFVGFIVLLTSPGSDVKTRFDVVDEYNGCDVVRYTTKSNTWKYFLDCTNRK